MAECAPKTVLVVDDDDWIREVLGLALKNEGYDVVDARDGLEALERVDERQPAVILLDLMMPRMDGMTFAGELRRRGLDREIPVIVLTADSRLGARAAQFGVAGCHIKPFDLKLLLENVSRLACPA